MWKILKRLLKTAIKPNQDSIKEEDQVDLFHPNYSNKDISVDEVFAANFSASGGHFLFCENDNELFENLREIIKYENVTELICFDDNLQKILNYNNIPYVQEPSESNYAVSFLNCEFLIAFDGSIMLSAHQTFGRNILDFPANFIIYARPSQLVDNVGLALQKLRILKKDNLPSKITSIRGKDLHRFTNTKNKKNIYLLLVEE